MALRFHLSILLALAACMLITPPVASSQGQTEIAPVITWMIGGSAPIPGGSVSIDNGEAYGAVFGTKVEKEVNVEFSYAYCPTKGRFNSTAVTGSQEFDMSVHLMQFGAAYHVLTDKVQPFMSTTLGGVLFRPNNGLYGSDLRFAFSVVFGVKFYPVENIGLRLQARGLFPVYFSSGGFWGGVEGSGRGIPAGIRMVQADFGGGIIIAF